MLPCNHNNCASLLLPSGLVSVSACWFCLVVFSGAPLSKTMQGINNYIYHTLNVYNLMSKSKSIKYAVILNKCSKFSFPAELSWCS